MRELMSRRPSPALVVSALALVAAVAGQALAEEATVAKKKDKLTKKEKRQVKKLIAKAAPGLDVNSAKSADTATNATNAQNANDADRLDGKEASELQTTSAYAERAADLSLTSSFQDVVTTNVTTTGTRIVATASLELDANGGSDDVARCRLRIAGTESFTYDHNIIVGASAESTMALTFARTVAPGTHAVELECSENVGGNVIADDAALSVVGVGE